MNISKFCGKANPSGSITHVPPLDEEEQGYEIFDGKMDDCIKAVLKP